MASIAVGSMAASFLVAAAPAAASVSFTSSSSLRMASSVSAVASLRVKSGARRVLMMAAPEKTTSELQEITEKIEKAVHEAEDVCKGDDTVECVALWEEVEELSAARAHKKVQYEMDKDPLDKFCDSNPEADECRTYED